MSLTRAQGGLSNPVGQQWVITVIVIVMVAWPVLGNLISTYVNACAAVTLLTAAYVQQRNTATPATAPVRCRLSGAS
jgi:hypothetical protein